MNQANAGRLPSLHLESIRVGSSKPLDLARLPSALIQRTQAAIHHHLLKETLSQGVMGQIQVRFVGAKVFVKSGESDFKEVCLGKSQRKELTLQVHRTVNFARQVAPDSAPLAPLPERVNEVVENMKKDASSCFGKAFALTTASTDGYSMVRQGLSAAYTEGRTADILSTMGFVSGGFWMAGSAFDIANGYAAQKNKSDEEGILRGRATIASGVFGGSAGVLYTIGKGFEVGVSPVADAAVGLSFASTALFGIGSVIGIGLAALGIHRCRTFRKYLDEYLENPNLSDEEKLTGAIRFLRDSVSLTEVEKIALQAEVREENSGKTEDEIKTLIEQKIKEKIEAKINHLKRRTSLKSLNQILQNSETILNLLKDPTTQEKGIAQAKALIETVKADNRKKMILHVITLIATLINLAGMIAGTIASAGTLPMVLLCMSGGILFITAMYNLYKGWKDKGSQADLLLVGGGAHR